MHGLPNKAPKKFRKTPSAASIFTKRFRHIDFWTSIMSIFWNFFDSCAIRIEEITKLIYEIIGKKREHNGHMFLTGAKSDFLGRNILTCDTPTVPQFAYFGFSN